MTLTIISFNMWDNPTLKNERAKWVYENIIQQKPDIILLQEVTNSILLELVSELRNAGYQYKISNNKLRKVYEMICSRRPIIAHKFKSFSTSNTNRGILLADIQLQNDYITVASTQLEQGESNYTKRVGQLSCVLDFLEENDHNVIIGCDTGFLKDEYFSINKDKWKDAWIDEKNKFARYTIDSNRNNYAKIQARADRIYYLGFIHKEPTFELIGTEEGKHPSMHFGIKITI